MSYYGTYIHDVTIHESGMLHCPCHVTHIKNPASTTHHQS